MALTQNQGMHKPLILMLFSCSYSTARIVAIVIPFHTRPFIRIAEKRGFETVATFKGPCLIQGRWAQLRGVITTYQLITRLTAVFSWPTVLWVLLYKGDEHVRPVIKYLLYLVSRFLLSCSIASRCYCIILYMPFTIEQELCHKINIRQGRYLV